MNTTAETSLWCRWCGTPVEVDRESADPVERLQAQAVHAGTEKEQCQNKRHTATPTDDPSLCLHDPDEDTAYTSVGRKAVLKRDVDVPVEAKCLVCQQWVRREQRSVTGPDSVWHLKYGQERM